MTNEEVCKNLEIYAMLDVLEDAHNMLECLFFATSGGMNSRTIAAMIAEVMAKLEEAEKRLGKDRSEDLPDPPKEVAQ